MSGVTERMNMKGVDRWLHVFYCAGRRMHFGEHSATELDDLKTQTKAAGLVGALTLGELDTMEVQGLKFPQFHNAAVVCIGA